MRPVLRRLTCSSWQETFQILTKFSLVSFCLVMLHYAPSNTANNSPWPLLFIASLIRYKMLPISSLLSSQTYSSPLLISSHSVMLITLLWFSLLCLCVPRVLHKDSHQRSGVGDKPLPEDSNLNNRNHEERAPLSAFKNPWYIAMACNL